jgi:hypothetical protein
MRLFVVVVVVVWVVGGERKAQGEKVVKTTSVSNIHSLHDEVNLAPSLPSEHKYPTN